MVHRQLFLGRVVLLPLRVLVTDQIQLVAPRLSLGVVLLPPRALVERLSLLEELLVEHLRADHQMMAALRLL